MAQCVRPVPHGVARRDLALSTGGKSHGGRRAVWRGGGPESGDAMALARARAVPGDKLLETCDNDEKETTTTFTGVWLTYRTTRWHPYTTLQLHPTRLAHVIRSSHTHTAVTVGSCSYRNHFN